MSEVRKTFSSGKFSISFKVTKEFSGTRLDHFMQKQLETLSRSFLQKKIKKGDVTISHRPSPHKPCTKIYEGEVVTMVTLDENGPEENWLGNPLPLDLEPTVVFEDSELLIVSKPPFMLTHPTGKHLFYCATVFFSTLYGKKIYSIHRIDRETSGLLVLGKSLNLTKKMTQYFEKGLIKKCYFLIGVKRKTEYSFPFFAHERLGSSGDPNSKERVFIQAYPENSYQGKHAKTQFDLIYENEHYILALAYLYTGRQHQIRAHAAFHGFPLLGDKIYLGNPELFGRFKDGLATLEDHQFMQISRHALHAIALNFPYGDNVQERKTIIGDLPADLAAWIQDNLSFPIEGMKALIDQKIRSFFQNENFRSEELDLELESDGDEDEDEDVGSD